MITRTVRKALNIKPSVMSIIIFDFTNGEVYVLKFNPDLDVEFQIEKLFSSMNNGATINNCEYMVVHKTQITYF